MNGINVNKAIGEQPNEIWLRTGQLSFILGALMLAGFKGFGVEVDPVAAFAPYILMGGGIGMMFYGTKLREKKRIAEQRHELSMAEKRDSGRPKSEPTEGDEAFWKAFKAKSPMTRAEFQLLEVAHDRKKTKDLLLETIKYLRFGGYSGRGKAVEYGNMYYTREQFEEKYRNKTIFQ